MEEYIALKEENKILEKELEKILSLIFEGVEEETRFDSRKLFAYLKEVYPNRWKKHTGNIS